MKYTHAVYVHIHFTIVAMKQFSVCISLQLHNYFFDYRIIQFEMMLCDLAMYYIQIIEYKRWKIVMAHEYI